MDLNIGLLQKEGPVGKLNKAKNLVSEVVYSI